MFSSLRNRVALSKSKTNSNDGLAKSKTKTKTSTNRYKKHTNRIELTTSSSSSAAASVNKENILNKIDEEETEKQVDSKYTSSSSAAIALSKEMASNSKNNICSSVLTDPFNKLKIESTKSSSATLTAVAVATSMFSPTNQTAKCSQSIEETSPEVSPRGRFADECEYRMNHPKRGIAVIINNKRFDPRLEMPVREGTDRDAAKLETTLIKLGFDIRLVHNYTAGNMRELMLKWANADHSDKDCFVCVIMSHGEEGSVYGSDKSIELDQIINPFKLNKTLAGKPKLFFIQACRGSNFMEGIDSNPFDVQYVNKIPVEADFLIAYSTISGYYSWRNSVNGSWFIQSLCEILSEYGKTLEIMQLLTMVNRKVAFNFESNTNDPSASGKKQIPCIVSMLTKELYFKNKSVFMH